MENKYLQIEYGTGLFFEYSKNEKEGYKEFVSSKGNTSYRKYYKDGVKGVLQSVSIYESKIGHQLSMRIVDGDTGYYVPVNLYDIRGNVDNTFAESLIKLLPALNKNDEVIVRGYNFTPEGEQYAKTGISITANGEKLKPQLTNSYYKNGELVEGDIPALEWKENKVGKKKPTAVSLEQRDDFLVEVLDAELSAERLGWTKDSDNAPAQEEAPKQESAPQAQVTQERPKYQVAKKQEPKKEAPATPVGKNPLPF